MSTRQEPCGWTPDVSACRSGPCCPDVDAPANAAVKAIAEQMATNLLWRLTGMRYGCCEITVRPCKPRTCDPLTLVDIIYFDQRRFGQGGNNLGVFNFSPTLVDGQVFNIACGCPTGCCTCRSDCEVRLPGPVCSITSVQENGTVLDPDQYYVLDNNRLILKYRWVPSTDAGRYTSIIGAGFPTIMDPADRWNHSVAPASVGANTVDYGGGSVGSSGAPNSNVQVFMPELPDASYTVQFLQNGDQTTVYEFATAPFFSNTFTSYQYPTTDVPIGGILNAGDVLTSNINNNTSPPTRTRFTVLSGQFTRTSLQGFQVSADAEYMIEFEERQDGGCFPCQDYNKELGEDGTWGITYTIGEPVPDELNFAAGLYACELAKSILGEACALPQRVQSVARQGVQVAFVDPIILAEAGLTGIPIVDQIIRAFNPSKLAQASYVWSPDLPKVRRETP